MNTQNAIERCGNNNKFYPAGKSLFIFDLDETLFCHDHTKLKVLFRDNLTSEIVKEATFAEAESNGFSKPLGTYSDMCVYKNAAVFEESAIPIEPMIQTLLLSQLDSTSDVVIVTAREQFDEPDRFADHLKNFNINCPIFTVGELWEEFDTAARKRVLVEELLNSHDYQYIVAYDDCASNLYQFHTLRNKYPTLYFYLNKVTFTGNNLDIKSYIPDTE